MWSATHRAIGDRDYLYADDERETPLEYRPVEVEIFHDETSREIPVIHTATKLWHLDVPKGETTEAWCIGVDDELAGFDDEHFYRFPDTKEGRKAVKTLRDYQNEWLRDELYYTKKLCGVPYWARPNAPGLITFEGYCEPFLPTPPFANRMASNGLEGMPRVAKIDDGSAFVSLSNDRTPELPASPSA